MGGGRLREIDPKGRLPLGNLISANETKEQWRWKVTGTDDLNDSLFSGDEENAGTEDIKNEINGK